MKKRSIFSTAIPHVVFAAVAVSGIIYAERLLLSRTARPTIIPVMAVADEELEKELVEQAPVSDEGLPDNIKAVLQGPGVAEKLAQEPYVVGLVPTDRNALYALVATRLYEADNFAEAAGVLALMDPAARVANEVQFIYAYSLAKQAQPEKAIEQYRALVQQEPNHQSGNLNLALLLRQQKKCDLAIPYFAHAVEVSGGTKKAKAFSGQASCYLEMGQPQQAEPLYIKSIEYRPGSHATWRQLARTYVQLERSAEAFDAFDKSIALSPNDFRTYIDKAEYQLAVYQINGAKRTLTSARAVSTDPRIIELLAWSYLEDGARNSARAQLRYLIDNSASTAQTERAKLLLMYVEKDYQNLLVQLQGGAAQDAEMRYLEGLTYRKIGYFKSALKVFDDLAAVQSYRLRAEVQKTRIARARHQYENAAERYAALLAQTPNANALWFESALVAEAQNNFTDGLEKIEQALALEADNQVYIITRARLLMRLDRPAEAEKELQDLLAARPKNTRALKMLAAIHVRSKDYTALAGVYERLMEIEPDDIDVELRYAGVQIKLENYDTARASLLNIIEQKPDHIGARQVLASLLFDLERFEEAAFVVEQILQLAPDNEVAQELKQKMEARPQLPE